MKELNERIEAAKRHPGCNEAWKFEAIDELGSAGILNDPQGWKAKINEPIPTGAVMAILNRIYQKLSEKK